MTDDPVRNALRDGFAALLKGDTKERDRQVERARKVLDAQRSPPKVTASPAEIVSRLLMIAERQMGRALTAQERAVVEQNPAAFGEYLLKSGYKIPADIASGTFERH